MTLGVSITLEANPNYPASFLLLQPAFQASTVTFTFTEAIDPSSFTLADVRGLNPEVARLSDLTQISSTVWTATLTAHDDLQKQSTEFWLNLNGINDARGQPGPGGAQRTSPQHILVDTLRPTTDSIVVADRDLTADETTTVTFTFSEKVTGFDLDDVDLSNAYCTMVPGSLQANADGRTYTATMKTNENVRNYADHVVRVKLGGVRDEYGTPGEGNSDASVYFSIETRRPVFESATVDGSQLVLRYGSPVIPDDRLVLDADHKPGRANFTVSVNGVPVANAVAAVNVAGQTVTLTLTTPVTQEQTVTVSYTDPTPDTNDADAIQNIAGNDAASFTNQPVTNNTRDTTPPVLVITGPDAPTVNGQQLVLHYTDTNNLGATGPFATAFTVYVNSVVNTVTRAVVNPVTKTVTLTLATAVTQGQTVTVNYTDPTGLNDPNAVQDAAGNDAASFTNQPVTNNTRDTTPPVLVTTGPDAPTVNGQQLVLHYTDANNLGATGPFATAFTVYVNSVVNTVTGAVVNPVTKTVTLTLATAVTQGQTVTVNYTDPTGLNDANAVQDAAGNDAASFTNQPVTNNTPDTTPPVLVTAGADAPTVNGQQLVLHYTDANNLGATGPFATAFTVYVNSVVNTVTGAIVNPVTKTVTLTLATAVTQGQTVAVNYTDPTGLNDANAVQDAAGNDAASFTNQPVTNNTRDTTPPVLVTAGADAPTVNGHQLVLHYTDANNLGSTEPLATAFTVYVNGAANTVTGAIVNPVTKTVTLTLATAVTQGQTVTVNYTDPTGLNDANAVQDAAGNDAASFTNQPVTNNTRDTTPPVLVTAGPDAPTVNGHQLVLHYTDADNLGATEPLATAFTVYVNGAANAVTGAIVNPVTKTVTLTLATAVTQGQTVTVNYTDPTGLNDANAVQDAAGNDAASFTNQPVTNNTRDTTPPVLVTTGPDAPTVNGHQLVLHYTDASNLGATGPDNTAFAVHVNGVANAVTGAIVNPVTKTVTLTLATVVTQGQTVTVNYTDPTGLNDANAVQDAAGNDAASFTNQPVTNNTPDTTPPVLVTTGADAPTVNGQQLVLHYTDANNLGATEPDSTVFTVHVNGAANAVTRAIVNPVAKTVTLTLATAVTQGQTVTVNYTDPTPDLDDSNAIQDAAGNDAASFTNQPVTNNTQDTTPPALVTTGADAPTVNGHQLVLHYHDTNNFGATEPDNTVFTVHVNGAANAVTGAVVNPVAKTVTLTLATPVTQGQTVTVNYTDPTPDLDDSDAIQDAAGNDAASFTNQPVINNSPPPVTPTTPTDTRPPVLVTTGPDAPTVNGHQLVLHYHDTNNLDATEPDSTAFAVHVNGVANTVTRAIVNPVTKTVTLTLATAVTQGQTVTVNYTDPTPDLDDSNAIQDTAGNDAASFTSQSVINNSPASVTPTTPTPTTTTDTTPPVLVTTGPDVPTVNGHQLVLHYHDTNNLGAAGPLATAFTVHVNGVANAVTRAVVNPVTKTVTLTLATAVTQGQTVTVNYTDLTPDLNDSNAIQDAAGNDAASFTSQPVTNITAAPPPTTPTTETSTMQTQTQASTAVTPTAPNSSPSVSDDTDGVPAIQEDQIPGLTRPGGAAPVAGDGNGDGIRDSQQSTVASMNGMTLVATGENGKPLTDTNVRISGMEQKAAPANLPKGLEMPIGLLNFAAQPLTTAGSTESFSLYVDPTRSINGYWAKDNAGVWVNLASEPYGGKMVTEGNRLRLDFKITDGGQFDVDGKADGSITASGAAAHMQQLSIVGQAPDFAHGGFWF